MSTSFGAAVLHLIGATGNRQASRLAGMMDSGRLRAHSAEYTTVNMTGIPFFTTDWSSLTPTERRGASGLAYWRTVECGGIRVRMVEYTPGYVADHWCSK